VVNNVGLVSTSILFGKLMDGADLLHSYDQVTFFSCFLASIALVVSIITHFYDAVWNKGILGMNVEDRNIFYTKLKK
jgi:hypothetical protein